MDLQSYTKLVRSSYTQLSQAIITSIWYNNVMNTSAQNREKVVKQAIANEKLEGLKVSREAQKIADNYVVGKASAKTVAAKIRARYGAI